MVNVGGDIRGMTNDPEPTPWIIGIEDPNKIKTAVGEIRLTNGGVAASGDLHRYCTFKGARLGHILNPKTGWPAKGAPRSVTVMGNYSVEAGFLSTLAILQDKIAKSFLDALEVPAQCVM
jgi:thiamine biosynthesis lipoprotein